MVNGLRRDSKWKQTPSFCRRTVPHLTPEEDATSCRDGCHLARSFVSKRVLYKSLPSLCVSNYIFPHEGGEVSRSRAGDLSRQAPGATESRPGLRKHLSAWLAGRRLYLSRGKHSTSFYLLTPCECSAGSDSRLISWEGRRMCSRREINASGTFCYFLHFTSDDKVQFREGKGGGG